MYLSHSERLLAICLFVSFPSAPDWKSRLNVMNADSSVKPNVCNETAANERKTPIVPLESSQINKTPIQILNTSCALRKTTLNLTDPNLTFPDHVRSIKEKECWLLFQKMINKGISVTYETILRGVLTPSEFRAVERKQKEMIEQLNVDASSNLTNAPNTSNTSNTVEEANK